MSCTYRQRLSDIGPLSRPFLNLFILELMQINMSLCIIYKLVNVVYEKTIYEGTIFVNENL